MTETGKHLDCQEVVELVTDYLEGTLPPDQTTLFEQHLNFCDGCVWYLEQMRATIATVGRLREEDIPVGTRQQLLATFRDWKRS
jgi:anti-sigma factor RsiW